MNHIGRKGSHGGHGVLQVQSNGNTLLCRGQPVNMSFGVVKSAAIIVQESTSATPTGGRCERQAVTQPRAADICTMWTLPRHRSLDVFPLRALCACAVNSPFERRTRDRTPKSLTASLSSSRLWRDCVAGDQTRERSSLRTPGPEQRGAGQWCVAPLSRSVCRSIHPPTGKQRSS